MSSYSLLGFGGIFCRAPSLFKKQSREVGTNAFFFLLINFPACIGIQNNSNKSAILLLGHQMKGLCICKRLYELLRGQMTKWFLLKKKKKSRNKPWNYRKICSNFSRLKYFIKIYILASMYTLTILIKGHALGVWLRLILVFRPIKTLCERERDKLLFLI